MFKKLLSVLCVILLSFSVVGQAFASNQDYTEEKLDNILLKAGYPEEYVKEMEYEYKLQLITIGGENFKFEGRETANFFINQNGELEELPKIEPGNVSIFGVIPTTDLITSIDVLNTSDASATKRLFTANFKWVSANGIKNDRLGMALPEGWDIIPTSFSCLTYYSVLPSQGAPYNVAGSCGGRTSYQNLYGADWTVGSNANDKVDSWYKGWVMFEAKRTSSNALNKIVANYAHDLKAGTSSISVSIGPVTVTHVPTSGSINTAGWSKNF